MTRRLRRLAIGLGLTALATLALYLGVADPDAAMTVAVFGTVVSTVVAASSPGGDSSDSSGDASDGEGDGGGDGGGSSD